MSPYEYFVNSALPKTFRVPATTERAVNTGRDIHTSTRAANSAACLNQVPLSTHVTCCLSVAELELNLHGLPTNLACSAGLGNRPAACKSNSAAFAIAASRLVA